VRKGGAVSAPQHHCGNPPRETAIAPLFAPLVGLAGCLRCAFRVIGSPCLGCCAHCDPTVLASAVQVAKELRFRMAAYGDLSTESSEQGSVASQQSRAQLVGAGLCCARALHQRTYPISTLYGAILLRRRARHSPATVSGVDIHSASISSIRWAGWGGCFGATRVCVTKTSVVCGRVQEAWRSAFMQPPAGPPLALEHAVVLLFAVGEGYFSGQCAPSLPNRSSPLCPLWGCMWHQPMSCVRPPCTAAAPPHLRGHSGWPSLSFRSESNNQTGLVTGVRATSLTIAWIVHG
jgi:hypothetical protein